MRYLIRTAATLAIVLLLAAAALAWFASTERALTWLAQSANQWSGGRLELQQPSGSLLGPLAFARVRYRDAEREIDARGVALDWQPAALLGRRVSIDALTADSIDLRLEPSTEPARLPEQLALPLPVAISRVHVASLRIESGARKLPPMEISLGYRGDTDRSRIENLKIIAPAGQVTASIEVAATRPFAISANAAIATKYDAHALTIDAKIAGTLEHMDVTGDVQAAAARASGTMQVDPLADMPLVAAQLDATGIDLAQWIPSAPRSDLSVVIAAMRDDAGAIRGTLRANNGKPGRFAQGHLPLHTLASDFHLADTTLALRSVDANFGAAGRATGSVDLTLEKASLQLTVAALDLKALHAPLHATRLSGDVRGDIRADGSRFDLRLKQKGISVEASAALQGDTLTIARLSARAGTAKLDASGQIGLTGAQSFKAKAQLYDLDPSALGDYPAARLSSDLAASGRLQAPWLVDLNVMKLGGQWRGASLAGSGRLALSPAHVTARGFEVRVGNNSVRANGAFGAPQDRLDITLAGNELRQLDGKLRGSLRASGSVFGTLDQLGGDAKFAGTGIAFADAGQVERLQGNVTISRDADRRIDLALSAEGVATNGVRLSKLDVKSAGSLAKNETRIDLRHEAHALSMRLTGRWLDPAGWAGSVDAFDVKGPYRASLREPTQVEIGPGRIVVGAAQLQMVDGNVRLERLSWKSARLTTRGAFDALPLKPLLALAGMGIEVDTTLRLRGDWSIEATPRLNGRISVARESGDLVFSKEPVLAAQLRDLSVEATLREDRLDSRITVTTERLGRATGSIAVLPAPGAAPGTIAGNAPLQAELRADVATLRPLNALFGTTALIDGRLNLDLRGSGTVAKPVLVGKLTGDALRIEVPIHGVNLRDGKLQAELTPSALVLKELSLRGGEGSLAAMGEMPRSGTQETRIKWQARQLLIFARPDRKLIIDGAGSLALLGRRLAARGEINAREGHIEFAYRRGVELGDDVVVLGRAKAPAAKAPAVIDADITFDFGNRFHLRGQGLETGLEGRIRLTTAKSGALLSQGEVRAVHGTYTFLGQRLTIDRGRLIFQGPPHNPGLDVRALRKLPQVEVGVALQGTVRSPQVSLTSNPPMSRGEQMAWLVLGHDPSNISGADAGLLQAAASALGSTSSDAVPITRRFADAVGVDEISLQGATTATGQGQVVAVGKRLSDRIYVTVEQGLNVAKSLFRLEFVVHRFVSLRIESGTIDGVPITGAGVVYGRSFD